MNKNTEVDPSVLNAIPQYQPFRLLESSLSMEETRKGIAQLKNKETSGKYGIASEMYKALMDEDLDQLKSKFGLI